MEIKIPEVGESVREALLAKWFKKNGDFVKRDEPLCEIETDKITLDLNADASGVLTISVSEGTTVAVGAIIGAIEESTAVQESTVAVAENVLADELAAPASSPSLRREMREQNIAPEELTGSGKGGRLTHDDLSARIVEKSKLPPASRPAAVVEAVAVIPGFKGANSLQVVPSALEPAVSLSAPQVVPVVSVHTEDSPAYAAGVREERRAMSPLRKRIAERLVAARQKTAMLTTFNEADLSHVKKLRNTYREHFLQRHGIALGYMPFFVKACIEALKEFPLVNARIDGDDIVYHRFYDIGVAIGGDKGLVVPVLRDADRLKMYEIDQTISAFAEKIKTNRLAISDLEGGTFTISNGGVYGSMLSTPILNPPQSAVLGMHAIQDRAVVRDGQIVIRPMMYLALSYDHRVIDGREAVGFLKKVKEYIEEPEELLLEG
ncbi:MAG: 2-oxoglutarate dehydrogenase complex dihydrolipoyllysine-residue succinyltransferase [Desulfuromonadaceae bacterium]|nr:2-oxoglutarate dehydrogenase complex dihydrolipoyllysine-residue succinyltransferase [Desulfuromonadaceae bacterium]MDD2848719.1 2-oxoglutarate dehydrogenase complex dihydrolipoyllysine-residue succinyltransferase [Desulfuromonadaceae bacterium]MDD4130778.1 2-oxoglutarate dehydrogenase complex dihydrolipoyllysine-residue succinyltransferase [Desulfuromonadaceae bacterium]